jgi:hypothetical protein
MSSVDRVTSVEAALAFTRAEDVGPDAERPGLLRARTRPPEVRGPSIFDLHTCRLRDWAECEGFQPDLLRHGFDCVDLPPVEGLRALLERVRDAGRVREEDAREIRRRLAGAWLRLRDGSHIRLLFIAPEGFIMRRAGPNGMAVSPPGSMTAMNGHDAAQAVHADQDVLGTPLRQIMRGAAPWLFRHDAPDSRNRWSPLLLLNLWLPLQQITRPLALMDKQTLDRRAQQLRYGLPTDAFLDRDEERRVNDIWTFLHDDRQQWYFRAEMSVGHAYVFETLGTPHGSFVVPGEERAERRVRQLDAAGEAIRRKDEANLREAVAPDAGPAGPVGTAPLHRAIEAMEALIDEARAAAASLGQGVGAEAWLARAQRAGGAVVRKSLEMRAVAVRTPGLSWLRRPAESTRSTGGQSRPRAG